MATFDPEAPRPKSKVRSDELRNNFNALNDKIEAVPPCSGGDVTGPASASDGAPALFDGASGKTLKQVAPLDLINTLLNALPTTDPHDGTRWWNNNGVITRSVPRTTQLYRFTGIASAGTGYQPGDILTPATGEPVTDPPALHIQSVDENGAVTAFDNGAGGTVFAPYYDDTPPDGSTSGGSGSGFVSNIATGA